MVHNPQERDWRPKLTGQENYGPLRLPRMKGPMHLWNHVSPPPAQNTIIVRKDGEVWEGNNFDADSLFGPDTHRAFIGGYDHRCDPVEDPFAFDALGRAGYSCCYPLEDIYDGPVDHYSDPDEYAQKGKC